MKKTKKFLSLALALILMLSLLPVAAFAGHTDNSVPEAFRGTWKGDQYTLVIGEKSCDATKGGTTVTLSFSKMTNEKKAYFATGSNYIYLEIGQTQLGEVYLLADGDITFEGFPSDTMNDSFILPTAIPSPIPTARTRPVTGTLRPADTT